MKSNQSRSGGNSSVSGAAAAGGGAAAGAAAGKRDPQQEIDYWLQYVDCACTHEHIPGGHHIFTRSITASQEIRDLYLCLFKLYNEYAGSANFREPVNALELGVLHYYTVIHRPMSLRVILDRIVEGKYYASTEEILQDVELIWANCVTFNGAQSAIALEAQKCKQELQRLRTAIEDDRIASTQDVDAIINDVVAFGSEAVDEALMRYFMQEDPTMIENNEIILERSTMKHIKAMRAIIESAKQTGGNTATTAS